MPLTIRPPHQRFVAAVTGLDVRVPADAAPQRAIIEFADSYAVLIFPDQHITDDGRRETVLWDNRCTMHRACEYDPLKIRELHRTTVMEPSPPMAELTRNVA